MELRFRHGEAVSADSGDVNMEQNAQFEGWAIIEVYGHQQAIGFVSTRYFGNSCLFQVDTPEISERDFTLESPQYVEGKWTSEGAKVRKKARASSSQMLGPGSIFRMTPCSEEVALNAVDRMSSREIVVLEIPKDKVRELLPGESKPQAGYPCCGGNPEDGHEEDCLTGVDDEDNEG
jgi:hypothetical protein